MSDARTDLDDRVQLVLIRHGSREGDGLSQHGRHQIKRLAHALSLRGIKPSRYVSSRQPAAIETRDRLAGALTNETAPVTTSETLTPGSVQSTLDDLVAEIFPHAPSDDVAEVAVLVGHEGRLSNLLTELMSERSRPFPHGGAACIGSSSLSEMLRGHGKLQFRYPTVDHQEEALRPKAQSKMAVASFFAGFVFAALITILVDDPVSAWRRAAVVVLTLALALFVVCIYIYDELSMPEGFWTDGPRPRLHRLLATRRERRNEERWLRVAARSGEAAAEESEAEVMQDGRLFVAMVATSRWIFTPAVILALVGFASIVLSTSSIWVKVTCLGAIAAASVYYWLRRPDVGPD